MIEQHNHWQDFVETVAGTPVYPIHARVASNPELIFPNVNGQPATGPAEVNNILGWEDRRWT